MVTAELLSRNSGVHGQWLGNNVVKFARWQHLQWGARRDVLKMWLPWSWSSVVGCRMSQRVRVTTFATITNVNHHQQQQQQQQAQAQRSGTARWRPATTSTRVTAARRTASSVVCLRSTRSNAASSVFVPATSPTCSTSPISWPTRRPSSSTKLSSMFAFYAHYISRPATNHLLIYRLLSAMVDFGRLYFFVCDFVYL